MKRIFNLIIFYLLFTNFLSCYKEIIYEPFSIRNMYDKAKRGIPISLITEDGTEYDITVTSFDTANLTGMGTKRITAKSSPEVFSGDIPMEDIVIIKSYSYNMFKGFAVYGTAHILFTCFWVGLLHATHQGDELRTDIEYIGEGGSCPFIYSRNGTMFMLDAEPFGGAICKALQRAEWSCLDYCVPIDSTYHLLVRNELNETQHIDELSLVVFDHDFSIAIASDGNGNFYEVSNLIGPRTIRTSPYQYDCKDFQKKDGKFWKSNLSHCDLDNLNSLRDTLIFTFQKPTHAQNAKLLIKACTTLWGFQMGKEFLKLRGRTLPAWYRRVNKKGKAYDRLIQWYHQEELYLLSCKIATKSGWQSRAILYGASPFVPEERAYEIEISDIVGDSLTIMLTPPINFWMIDYIAVDYSEKKHSKRQEIGIHAIQGDNDGSIARNLLTEDGEYYIMPNQGDSLNISFRVPMKPSNQQRTIFLKASGYYTYNLKNEGPPKLITLNKLRQNGYSTQFAMKKYLDWKSHFDRISLGN